MTLTVTVTVTVTVMWYRPLHLCQKSQSDQIDERHAHHHDHSPESFGAREH